LESLLPENVMCLINIYSPGLSIPRSNHTNHLYTIIR